MTEYLYLLPFADGKFFKIGLSSKDDKRILKLHRDFRILFDQALIVTSSKPRILKVIEDELKISLEQSEHPYGKTDGHTEIRSIDYFEVAIEIIKQKHSSLGIRILKYKEFFNVFSNELVNYNSKNRVHIRLAELQKAESNFLNLLGNNTSSFERFDFVSDSLIVLTFNKDFPYYDIQNKEYIGCIDVKEVKAGFELYFHFGLGRPLSDESNGYFIDDICKILDISPKYGTKYCKESLFNETEEIDDSESEKIITTQYKGSMNAMLIMGQQVKLIKEILIKTLHYVDMLYELKRLD